jgi:Ca-activated chloride channel family protein
MTSTPTIVLMTEDEVSRYLPTDDEPGFGALSTARGPLPLKALDVQARIDGLLAETTVRQTFVNTHAEPLEATYIFPLPDRAAVTAFRMEVGGRVVEGVLKERGEARRTYDQAIRAGHRAAITEEERPGVFTLRVGNLPPGESATVQLSMSGPLIYDAGEVTFRFPLVVAPRYIPGSALPGASVGDGVASDTDAVPDASRISPPVLLPGYPSPVRLSLSVDIESSALAPRDFCCSLHSVLVEGDGCLARIRLQPGERLNRDFVLRFRVGDEGLRSSLALLPDRAGAAAGTFALTLLPPAGQGRVTRARDVVFVLDRSGSMGGWKMVAARRALGRMVDTLTERDRFAVYAFDDRIETVPEFRGASLAVASDRNRFRAVEFLAKIDARGGTEMAQPLSQAVEQLASQGQPRDRILVLITDGQVGNEDQILRLLGKRLAGLRIFTLGIDQAVNEGFLKRLATLGGGFCEVVESEDRLDEVMKRLHSRIGTPLLTGLKLEEAGFSVEGALTVPGRLPDLFAGAALLVLGRYQGVPEGSFLLSGHDAAGRRWCEAVSSRLSGNPAVAKAWARAYVRELEDRFSTGQGDPRELERKIIEVSLKFGVLCRFTSYVAVDRSEVVNEGGEGHRIVQPVEMPAGWQDAAARPMACFAFAPSARLGAVPLPAMPAAPCAAPPPPPACAEPVEAQKKDELMDATAKKKTMLAKQVLQELNAEGRVSKETLLAMDDAARAGEERPPDAQGPGATPPASEAPPAGVTRTYTAALDDEDLCDTDFDEHEASDPERQPRLRGEAARGSKTPESSAGDAPAPGLFGRLFGLFKRRSPRDDAETATPAAEPVDLSAYRRRAADLLDLLRSGSGLSLPQRLHELGVLAVQLKALLEDLASVGAPPLELQPLQKLHAELTALREQSSPDEAAVGRLWARAEEVLRVFAGVPVEAPVGARREGFWK